MTTSVRSAENEIEIAENHWRMFDFYSLSPEFEVVRAGGLLRYTAKYGEAHGLPGTRMSAQYVRAVVAGFDPKAQLWRLGLHVSEKPGQQPVWIELTYWEPAQSTEASEAAPRVGRVLAEYLGSPLKLFGVKKPATEHKTGPLVPHKREEIPVNSAQAMARQLQLPVQVPGMWLDMGRNGAHLRLDKNLTQGKPGEIAPAYQNVEVDVEKGMVKMLPPTGLLGAFFTTPGRQIKFDEIRNVEYRHTQMDVAQVKESDSDNMLTEIRNKHHAWEVLLTMPGESLLIVRTTHVTEGDIQSRRVTDVGGSKFDTNFELGVDYYRKYEEDQRQMEEAGHFARSAALLFASSIGVKVVQTEIGTDLI
ncbi:MAG: hypothetical protein L0154_19345 [Chloroflexi bacterium]|nr:hypothetical protein [Chloroflexota bacterium]